MSDVDATVTITYDDAAVALLGVIDPPSIILPEQVVYDAEVTVHYDDAAVEVSAIPSQITVPIVTVVESGESGNRLLGFRHVQAIPEAFWVIDHPLDFDPNVTLVNSSGEVFVADLTYPSPGRVVAHLTAPEGGVAYLS